MTYTHKIGGALFVIALMASAIIPAFAENGSVTGTSTRPFDGTQVRHPLRIGAGGMGNGTSTPAFLEREAKGKAKAAANQCFRDAAKSANQTYQAAVRKAQDDYKAAVMAARQAMLDAKKAARTNFDSTKQAAKTQCGITTQTGSSTSPNL